MRLLLTNDDGVNAQGLQTLAAALQDDHDVWVVAPAVEQSSMSHSLTLRDPLRIERLGLQRYAVGGTPADCVYVALHHLLDNPPDLVISGINHGSNLGSDVHYSGTVAAAREACLQGVPAVAVSLHLSSRDSERHWDNSASVVQRIVAGLQAHPLSAGVVLNVNVPNVAAATLRGIRACALGGRSYEPRVEERKDPWGRSYVWIGGAHSRFHGGPGTDGATVEAGWASVCPLSLSVTEHSTLERLREWTDG